MLVPPRYLVALITPFHRAGELDLDAHRHNLAVLYEAGIRGYVLGGSNGEGPYLEAGERARLVEAAREVLGHRAHLMAGVMAETVREGTRQVDEATSAGADSLLVLTPTTLVRNRIDDLHGYYRALADHASVPTILYSVPNTTAFNLPEPSVKELSEHPNIVGMKDSSGDPVRLQRLIAAAGDDFVFWSGSSQALTLAVTAGAYGVITGSGNYAPRLVLDTLAAARRSPLKARELQEKLSAVSRRVESNGIGGVKAASEAAGLRPGFTRAPLSAPPKKVRNELADLLDSI